MEVVQGRIVRSYRMIVAVAYTDRKRCVYLSPGYPGGVPTSDERIEALERQVARLTDLVDALLSETDHYGMAERKVTFVDLARRERETAAEIEKLHDL